MTKKEKRIIAQQFAEVIKKRWKKSIINYDLVQNTLTKDCRVKHYESKYRNNEVYIAQVAELIGKN